MTTSAPSETKTGAISSHDLTQLLLNNATNRYHVTYNDFFYNHLAQGIIALARLGVGRERIEGFAALLRRELRDAAPYKPKGLDAALQKHIDRSNKRCSTAKKFKDDVIRGAKQTMPHVELLGSGNDSYYTLLAAYEYILSVQDSAAAGEGKDAESLDANEGCVGSVEDLIRDHFPALSNGMLGGLLHGLIQIGYGYAASVPWLVCEGLAYAHCSYLSLNLPNPSATASPSKAFPLFLHRIGSGKTTDLLEILRQAGRDESLLEFLAKERETEAWVERKESAAMYLASAVYRERPAELLKHVEDIGFPWGEPQNRDELQRLMTWVADGAVAVYALSSARNDFFLLHSITSAWALAQILPILALPDAVHALRAFLCAFVCLYVVRNAPELRDADQVLTEQVLEKQVQAERVLAEDHQGTRKDAEDDDEQKWNGIVDEMLRVDRDEHVYKLVQACRELVSRVVDEDEGKNEMRRMLYRYAAGSSMENPFLFD